MAQPPPGVSPLGGDMQRSPTAAGLSFATAINAGRGLAYIAAHTRRKKIAKIEKNCCRYWERDGGPMNTDRVHELLVHQHVNFET
jgi:hypothetical protein